MELALQLRSAWANRPENFRSFENWLICWILLPNAGYGLLWIIGAPPRPITILATGFAGLVVNRAPFLIKFLTFVAATMISAAFFLSALFNLTIWSMLYSLRFASELSPIASVEYVASGGAIISTLVAAWVLLQRSTRLVELRRIAAASALTILAAWADVSMSSGVVGSYDRIPDPGAPFTSAVSASGFNQLATGERHLVMVMVEAMGEPADPAAHAQLIDMFATPEVRARYDVTTGDTLFYGSTTSGEMRELCGRWGDYSEVMKRRDDGCLPARLAASGYRTQAWHSFGGGMFDRVKWYPNIGFETMRWRRELRAAGAMSCPGVFPGACDRDVPRQIGATLRAAKQPQFLYWLTVNSHLPVLESERLGTQDCTRASAALPDVPPMTCRLLQLFGDVGGSLAREISSKDFPPADILIVGDHIPPFFDRRNREQFAPDRVPWILLRTRSAT
jgi:hypothetical protein